MAAQVEATEKSEKSGPLTDLALTLPLFLGYHMGVVFLPVRNAADLLTSELQRLAEHSLPLYFVLTIAIGLAYVVPLLLLGRGQHLKFERFAFTGSEGIVYAIAMRLCAGYVVARFLQIAELPEGPFGLLHAAPALSSSVEVASEALEVGERLAGAVMSLGAGFYEELVFRVGFYGAGFLAIAFLFNVTGRLTKFFLRAGWALLVACAFSGWHHMGDMGEAFDLTTFVFRAACGLVFTGIYEWRGFAPAVWTHALYDLWVLALG